MLGVSALLLASATLAAGEAPKLPARVAQAEGVTEYRLDNGLRVLLIPDASQATVTVNITIMAGSEVEDYGETGAAHLLEHLVFKGSPAFPNVPAALNEHGANWNGSTWTDRTNYYETMPANDENLEFGIAFEASRLTQSYIRKSDLDSEMTVVRNEFEAGENSPRAVLSERMVSTAFLFHGYQHSTIGARSDLEGIPIERLQRFYRNWYRPENALLVVAGRFDEDKALASIARHFGPLKNPETPLIRPYTKEPAQDGERSVVLRRVGEVAAAGVLYHIPAASHPDAAVIDVISQVLAATPSGRVYRALVESKKAVSVEAYPFLWRAPSVIQVMAEVRKDGNLEAVQSEMLSVIEGLGASLPSAEEVERARNAILKNKTLVFAKSENLAIEMSEWAAMGDWRMFFVHRDRVEKVTPADVQRVAAAYLRPSNRTSGLFIPTATPERVEIPEAPKVEAMIAEYQSGQQGQDLRAETLALDPAVLEPRIKRSTAGGVKLALLPKKTRGGAVSGRLHLVVGNEADLKDRMLLNEYVASMLERGTLKRSRAQIKDAFDRLQAEIAITGSANATNVTFTTTRNNLPEVASLVFELLREPSFEAKELEVLRQEQIAAGEEALHEPQALAPTALAGYLFPKGHPSHQPPIAEQIDYVKKLTQAEIKTFHQDHYGAAEAYLAVVGDFDDAAVAKLVAEQLGDWRSPKPTRRIDAMAPERVKAKVESIETPDKENALTMAGVAFPARRSDPDYAALRLANYLIGGEQLNSRLSARLRQKDGLCYGAGSYLQPELRGDSTLFGFYAISAPQNAAAVEKGFREEMERARDQGFNDSEVKRAQESMLRELEVAFSRDAGLAGELVDELVRGTTTAWLGEYRSRVRAASAADVSAATRKHLDVVAMSLIRAGDFAGATRKASAPVPAEGGGSATQAKP